jgi:CubicO group peptidase (beta-lactamase class C family)
MDAEGIVAVGAVGAITYVDGEVEVAGFANLETQEIFTTQHRFRVGSIDVTFIAVVAVSVIDDLDASAANWLPQLDGRITLRHLLAHRSGLFDYMWDGETYERLAFGRRRSPTRRRSSLRRSVIRCGTSGRSRTRARTTRRST